MLNIMSPALALFTYHIIAKDVKMIDEDFNERVRTQSKCQCDCTAKRFSQAKVIWNVLKAVRSQNDISDFVIILHNFRENKIEPLLLCLYLVHMRLNVEKSMSMLFEDKDNISDEDYLKHCDAFKSVFDLKKFIENEYEIGNV